MSTVAPVETRPGPHQVSNTASSTSANVGTYYATHRFAPNSKLHRYLSLKASDYVSLRKTDYTLYEILLAMKKAISNDKLFDPQNPTVILCDENLEDALDVKALHVSEIREQVCKQFPRLSPPEAGPNKNGEQKSGQLGGQVNVQAPAQGQNQINVSVPNVPATLTPGQTQGQSEPRLTRSHTAPVVSTIPQAPPADNFALPAWASNTANAVTARMLFNSTPFDIEASYWVKPDFLKVLRSVKGVSQTQLIFPYRDITSILSKYIMENKNRFFDLRNIRVALVENDPLGIAFGVKAFARSQVTSLIRAQLKLYVPAAEAAKSNNDDESKLDDITVTKRKRSSDEESLEDDNSFPTASNSGEDMQAKRQRRRSCNVSVTILDYSSGEETIYSAQGYETAAICDESYSTDSDSSEDEEYTEENIYRVEYEIDNGSDDCEDDAERKKERADGSEEDSDIEDVLIASAVTSLLNEMESSDFANWADSDSELSDSTDSDFALSSYDPEVPHGSDVWKCVTCGQQNTPFMRYCHRCWEERKGWVPERPKPRRRKKEKKTNGIAVKKSATSQIQNGANNFGATSSGRSGNLQPIRHGLERSLSDPSGNVQVNLARITKDGHSDMENATVVLEGVKEGNLITTSSTSTESVGSGSQGSDSGFSQESQGILSQEAESDKEDAVAMKDVEEESTDSGQEEIVQKDLLLKKRQKMSLDFAAGKRRSPSTAELPILSSRNQELPPNLQLKTQHSVLLTPDTDSGCSDQTILTRNPTLSTSNPSLLCTMCCVRTKDACFIHGQISHQVCCYPCAKMIFKNRGTCPVCRRKIEKITRNIIV